MEKYTTIGELRQLILEQEYKYKHHLGFIEAIYILKSKYKLTEIRPTANDFFMWDLIDFKQLRLLVDSIPVSLSSITKTVENWPLLFKNKSNETSLLTFADVQISLEMPYSPDERIILSDYVTNLYVLKGQAILHLNNKQILLSCGDFIILTPGTSYYVECDENDYIINIILQNKNFHYIWESVLKQNKLLAKFINTITDSATGKIMRFFLPVTINTNQIIQNLFSEFILNDKFSISNFLSFMQILYANLLRVANNRNIINKTKSETSLKISLLQYIQKHYQTLTLSKLADEFHYNPAYLSRMIKQITNNDFSRIVTELRIEEAKRLLSTELNWSISKIACEVGYKNPEYFSTIFKQWTNKSPRQYRISRLNN